jgi:hypothetical protein
MEFKECYSCKIQEKCLKLYLNQCEFCKYQGRDKRKKDPCRVCLVKKCMFKPKEGD